MMREGSCGITCHLLGHAPAGRRPAPPHFSPLALLTHTSPDTHPFPRLRRLPLHGRASSVLHTIGKQVSPPGRALTMLAPLSIAHVQQHTRLRAGLAEWGALWGRDGRWSRVNNVALVYSTRANRKCFPRTSSSCDTSPRRSFSRSNLWQSSTPLRSAMFGLPHASRSLPERRKRHVGNKATTANQNASSAQRSDDRPETPGCRGTLNDQQLLVPNNPCVNGTWKCGVSS